MATWFLDEAVNNDRLNAQGNTGRNLTQAGGSVNSSTVFKMEGGASASFTTTPSLRCNDAACNSMNAPYSCALWVRPHTMTAGGYPAIVQVGNGGPAGFYIGYEVNGQRAFGGMNGNLAYTPNNSIPPNTWAHIALTFPGSADQVQRLYMNGAFAAQVSPSSYSPAPGAGWPLIVNDSLGGPSPLIAEVDELTCFTQVLTASSICRICSCGVRGEQCTCSGASYTNSGRNAANCGSCTLPACNAATPP